MLIVYGTKHCFLPFFSIFVHKKPSDLTSIILEHPFYLSLQLISRRLARELRDEKKKEQRSQTEYVSNA